MSLQQTCRLLVRSSRKNVPVIMGGTAARRGMAQTVPHLGSKTEMEAEVLQQLKARIAYQKQLVASQHGIDEEVHEMWRWVNITFWVAFPIVAFSGFYSLFFDEHHHREEGPLPEYMVIRNKEYPWRCDECDLFDLDCWKKCKAAKK